MVRTRLFLAVLVAGLALSGGCMSSRSSRSDPCDPCGERTSLMQRIRSAFRGRNSDCCCEGPSCCDSCGDGCCEGPSLGEGCGSSCGGGEMSPMMSAPPGAPLPGPGPLTPQSAVPSLAPAPQSRLVPQPLASPQAFRR